MADLGHGLAEIHKGVTRLLRRGQQVVGLVLEFEETKFEASLERSVARTLAA